MGYNFNSENSEIINDDIDVDLEMLREDLMAELQAINQYQEHIDTMTDEYAISVLEHIRDDEKEHVAELFKLVQMIDSVQAEKFKKETL